MDNQNANPTPARQYRDITLRFCAHAGDNVIVERKLGDGKNHFICLNPCGNECRTFGSAPETEQSGAAQNQNNEQK